MNLNNLRKFVYPFYQNKDIMHDLSHVERVLITLGGLIKYIDGNYDYEVIKYAAYFHGFIYSEEELIKKWLKEEGLEEAKIEKIIKVAWESQKEKSAETLEGKLLHDAHMIEGGEVFLITKSLITGSVRGQMLEQTIKYIENNILGKGICYFEKTQQIHKKAQEYTRQFLNQLKKELKCYKRGIKKAIPII